MKWLGYKQVKVSALRFDIPEIKRRSKAAHVAELASSVRENGDDLIHAPTVRVPGMALLCGRDRIAAITVLKAKKVWVHLVECDDKEAKALELTENVYRRPVENRAQMLADLVALRTGELTGAEGGTVSPAPQRSAKAEARRQVARAAGISPASVKKAEQRAKAAKESAAGDPTGASLQREPAASAVVPAPTLDLLGCDDASAEAVMAIARQDQDAIDEADKYLRLAQTALTKMRPGPLQQELHGDVHRVAGRVRSNRPAAVCPYCKGLPKATYEPLADGPCPTCGGLMYVSDEKLLRAAKELREGPPVVGVHGKFYPYADVRDGKVKLGANGSRPKANGRKTRHVVELPDGRVVDPEAEAEANDDAERAY